jgi:Na+/H+ antiporter NhaD/arsenite permease-like protein
LYPSATLTRPLFQALDPKLNLRFDYNYLFMFAQIQTVLLLCSAFFKNDPRVLLFTCLTADVVLIW